MSAPEAGQLAHLYQMADFTAEATPAPNGHGPVITGWRTDPGTGQAVPIYAPPPGWNENGQLTTAAQRVAHRIWYPGMDDSQLSDQGRAMIPHFEEAYHQDLIEAVRREKLRWDAQRMLSGDGGWAPPQRMSMTLREFLEGGSEEEEKIPFVIPGVLPQGCRLMLTGEEGRGKSTLIRWVTGCHAAGIQPWTGERYEGGTALLVDAENPPALLRLRLVELAAYLERYVPGAQEAMLERLVVESQPAGFDLSAQAWADYLGGIIADRRPGLVSGGPVYKLSSEPPKSEEFFGTISGVLGRLQVQYGFSLIIEAHCRQAGQDGERPEFPYGNTGWRRWPDMGFHLNARGDVTDWRGNRYGDDAPWPVRLIRVPGCSVGWEAVFPQQGSAAQEGGDIREKIARVVSEVTRSPGINQKALRAAVGGTGNQWIDAAVEDGKVARIPGGKGKPTLYYPAMTGEADQPAFDFASMHQMAKFKQAK